MSSMVATNRPPDHQNIDESNAEDGEETEINPNLVTTHLYLKPTHSTLPLDKEVVLRRIRQRKSMNKVKTAVRSLLGSPFPAAKPNKAAASVHQKRWVDDAFAAP